MANQGLQFEWCIFHVTVGALNNTRGATLPPDADISKAADQFKVADTRMRNAATEAVATVQRYPGFGIIKGIKKISGGDKGSQMPLSGDPLTADEIKLVVDWVNTIEFVDDGACVPANPTYSYSWGEVRGVFVGTCGGSSCHLNGEQDGQLNLDDIVGSTVNVASTQKTDLMLVDPGNPDKSYLFHKITGTGIASKMPIIGALTEAQVDLIRTWISDCANEDFDTGQETKGREAP